MARTFTASVGYDHTHHSHYYSAYRIGFHVGSAPVTGQLTDDTPGVVQNNHASATGTFATIEEAARAVRQWSTVDFYLLHNPETGEYWTEAPRAKRSPTRDERAVLVPYAESR